LLFAFSQLKLCLLQFVCDICKKAYKHEFWFSLHKSKKHSQLTTPLPVKVQLKDCIAVQDIAVPHEEEFENVDSDQDISASLNSQQYSVPEDDIPEVQLLRTRKSHLTKVVPNDVTLFSP
jgi:hypothetical protein